MLRISFLLLLVQLASISCSVRFEFPEECGINYIEPDNIDEATRIVGGFEAVPGSWPWQAYLKYQGEFMCGGTLIHPQWVLSAAHCFYGAEDPADWEIVLGEHDDSLAEGWEQAVRVEAVFVNPQYEDVLTDYDFTLVKLASPVEFNTHVAPACFPSDSDDLTTTFPPEQVCVVTGWGSIDPEGTVWGPTLKQDYAQLYSNQECGEVMHHPDWITDRMICAGWLSSGSSLVFTLTIFPHISGFRLTGADDPERCATLGFGDSGGPLVCRHPDTGKWTHLGAVSWGEFCHRNRYTPGVYANTINLRDWLLQILEENN